MQLKHFSASATIADPTSTIMFSGCSLSSFVPLAGSFQSFLLVHPSCLPANQRRFCWIIALCVSQDETHTQILLCKSILSELSHRRLTKWLASRSIEL